MTVVFRKGNVSIKKMKNNKYKLDYEEGNYKYFWKFIKELIGEKNNNFEAHSVVSLKELLKEKKNQLSYHHLSLFFQASRKSICKFRKRWLWKSIYKSR